MCRPSVREKKFHGNDPYGPYLKVRVEKNFHFFGKGEQREFSHLRRFRGVQNGPKTGFSGCREIDPW